jgi:hypothetical protein
MPPLASPSILDLVPPCTTMQAALVAWRPRAVAIVAYANDLNTIPTGSHDVTTDGITVQLPDPLQGYPNTRAALRRASARSATYWAGNHYVSHWILRLLEFSVLFSGAELRLLLLYGEIADAGPTDHQRAAVLKEFTGLIAALQKDQALLVSAETSYAAALPLFAEDQASLGPDIIGLAAATTALEHTMQELILTYTLNPMTQGLAYIVQKVGQVHIDQLHRTTAALQRIVDECTQAHRAVAQLAGEFLSLLGKYRSLETALQRAEGASFKNHLQQLHFSVARQNWQSLSESARLLL